MNIIEAILIGIIQGLTEFLPVSSSGHIELSKMVLGVELKESSVLFSILVHLATALATVVIYRKTIFDITRDVILFRKTEAASLGYKILLSAIPVVIVGLLFEDHIDMLFAGNLLLVSSALLVTGMLLLFTHFAGAKDGKVNYPRALIIGTAQAIAIIPGISRSGATISTALLMRINRDDAARFSFLMVLIPIMGASILEIMDYSGSIGTSTIGWAPLALGFVAAFISGLFACQWMIKLVQKGRLIYFAIYCLVVAFSGFIFLVV